MPLPTVIHKTEIKLDYSQIWHQPVTFLYYGEYYGESACCSVRCVLKHSLRWRRKVPKRIIANSPLKSQNIKIQLGEIWFHVRNTAHTEASVQQEPLTPPARIQSHGGSFLFGTWVDRKDLEIWMSHSKRLFTSVLAPSAAGSGSSAASFGRVEVTLHRVMLYPGYMRHIFAQVTFYHRLQQTTHWVFVTAGLKMSQHFPAF